MDLIVGISGATGSIYGIRLLQLLRAKGVNTHLIITATSRKIIVEETAYKVEEVEALASAVYDEGDLEAPISSGSFRTGGMVIVPCSMKTLSGIAHSYNANLLIRAADVTLKERRRLILVVRETPLHSGHLELMLKASHLGAVILPPMPAFYGRPRTIEDLVDHTVGKVLDLLGMDHHLYKRWGGVSNV